MATAAEVGLGLAEAKALLAGLQAAMVRQQLAEHVALGRVCPSCRAVLRVKDRRPHRLQTLFGTVEIEVSRLNPALAGRTPASQARRSPRSASRCGAPAARPSWSGCRPSSGRGPRSARPPGS